MMVQGEGRLTWTAEDDAVTGVLGDAREVLETLLNVGLSMRMEMVVHIGQAGKAPMPTVTHSVAVFGTLPTTLTTRSGDGEMLWVEADALAADDDQPDPTSAAPAQPDKPRKVEATPWSGIDREERADQINIVGRRLAQTLGRAPTMVEWDALRPDDWLRANSIAKTYAPNGRWKRLAESWCQS